MRILIWYFVNMGLTDVSEMLGCQRPVRCINGCWNCSRPQRTWEIAQEGNGKNHEIRISKNPPCHSRLRKIG